MIVGTEADLFHDSMKVVVAAVRRIVKTPSGRLRIRLILVYQQ